MIRRDIDQMYTKWSSAQSVYSCLLLSSIIVCPFMRLKSSSYKERTKSARNYTGLGIHIFTKFVKDFTSTNKRFFLQKTIPVKT